MSLPPVIQELVGLIGYGNTMALVRKFGGHNLLIPKTDASDVWHALAEVIGEAYTRVLAAARGGEYLYIALCSRALKIQQRHLLVTRYEQLIKAGNGSRAAVEMLVMEFRPISYRWVEIIVNSPLPEAPVLAPQGELF